jgi:hypothetical protein
MSVLSLFHPWVLHSPRETSSTRRDTFSSLKINLGFDLVGEGVTGRILEGLMHILATYVHTYCDRDIVTRAIQEPRQRIR